MQPVNCAALAVLVAVIAVFAAQPAHACKGFKILGFSYAETTLYEDPEGGGRKININSEDVQVTGKCVHDLSRNRMYKIALSVGAAAGLSPETRKAIESKMWWVAYNEIEDNVKIDPDCFDSTELANVAGPRAAGEKISC